MKVLTPLQQELYDELADTLDGMPEAIAEKEGQELAASIQKLNAAELRHNIKVFRECGV